MHPYRGGKLLLTWGFNDTVATIGVRHDKCKKKLNILKKSLTATRPTSLNYIKQQKNAIAFAAHRHVNVLLCNTTFLIFTVFVE